MGLNDTKVESSTNSSTSYRRKRKKKKKKKKRSKSNTAAKSETIVDPSKGGESNWNNLKRKLVYDVNAVANRKSKKVRTNKNIRKSGDKSGAVADNKTEDNFLATSFPDPSEYIACDCEMVGVGAGRVSALARASLVDWNGKIIYDKFVRPKGKITDYRTRVSGVRKRDMDTAVNFDRAQREVKALLEGKILVGHALKNDVDALKIKHPPHMIRDSALYRPLLKRNALGKWQANSLKNLSKLLGHHIQSGEHSSVEDARASMMVYRKHRDAWEASILKNNGFTNQSSNNVNYDNRIQNSNKNALGNKDDDVDIFASKKVHNKNNKANSEKRKKRSRSSLHNGSKNGLRGKKRKEKYRKKGN